MTTVFSESKKEQVLPESHPLFRGRNNHIGNTAFIGHPDKSALPAPVKGVHRRTCDTDDLLDIIHLALKGYQSYFELVNASDPWIVNFPFAWKLEVGNQIFNLTKNAVYIVDSFIHDKNRQIVKLKSGSNGEPPVIGDVLSLDFDNSKILNFQHAFPASDDVNRYFTDAQIAKNSTDPLVDTITYEFSMKPFERERSMGGIDAKPRKVIQRGDQLREQVVNLENGTINNVFGNLYEVGLCFTCWTSTQQRSAQLAKWFRIFMRRYRSILIANGVNQIWFVEQKKSLNIDRWRNDIIGRSLEYSALIEEQHIEEEAMLKSFQTYLVTSAGGDAEQLGFSTTIENKEIK